MSNHGLLQAIHSYMGHQIDPQKTLPLEYLESLNVTDLDAVTEDMFEIHEYTKEEVEFLLKELSKMIIKLEEEEEMDSEKPKCPTSNMSLQETLDELVKFIEYEEAMTVDTKTQRRIGKKLVELGIWKKEND